VFTPQQADYRPGASFMGGSFRAVRPTPESAVSPNIGRPPINTWTDAMSHGAIIALDPATGDRRWTFPMYDLTESGVMSTASDLVFTGGRDGYLLALDAHTGAVLWRSNLSSAQMRSAPITYLADGRQYLSYISGNVLVTFGLREK
jgi:alcohol dehydrogenase (cytochrome c)